MKKTMLFILLGLTTFFPGIALAQNATVRVPMCLQYPDNNTKVPCTGVVPVDSTTGNPKSWESVLAAGAAPSAATSTPQSGTVTSTGATATTGTVVFSTNTATIGPIVPNLNRPLRVLFRGVWSGTISVGTSVDNCTTVSSLTIGGMSWGVFNTNANEVVDVPSVFGVGYCLIATVSSGTLTYMVQQ